MSVYQIIPTLEMAGADDFLNVQHYEFPNFVPDAGQLQEAVNFISLSYSSAIAVFLSQSVVFRGCTVRRVDIANLPSQFIEPTGGTWAGQASFDRLPNMNAIIIQWSAATPYPRTARSYISGFTENANDTDGTPSASVVAACKGLGITLTAVVVSSFLSVPRVSVQYGGTPRIVTAYNEVDTVTCNKVWYTQRRRRKGVGS